MQIRHIFYTQVQTQVLIDAPAQLTPTSDSSKEDCGVHADNDRIQARPPNHIHHLDGMRKFFVSLSTPIESL